MCDDGMFEVRDLLKWGTFKVICEKEIPDGDNALTARFVLAVKSDANSEIKVSAFSVIGGHQDKLKHFIVHGAQALGESSSRLLLSLAYTHEFDISTSNFKLLYLLSTKLLDRRVLIKNPSPEFELDPP